MELKEYFQKPYGGRDSFLENVIFPIFGSENFEDCFDTSLLWMREELRNVASKSGISDIVLVGTIKMAFDEIQIFDVAVSSHVLLGRNRVGVQQLIRRVMTTYSTAFMVFHYEDAPSWDWRFSFCRKRSGSDDSTSGKRYTFLLGPGQSCRTAAENFGKLLGKGADLDTEDIIAAFDVEALSDEFFAKYKQHYERFVEYVTGKRFVPSGDKWIETRTREPNEAMYDAFGREDKKVRDYVKKLLGRIVFLHFVQKKGWLGVPQGGEWGEGDPQFMLHLFEYSSPEQKANFLDSVLEPLFEGGINTDNTAQLDVFDTGVALPEGSCVRIPYLNGGLFERDALDEIDTVFPSEYFQDLLEFFYQYNFTIDENDPDDAQVGIDPEMLGRIFENLLEDNNDKGAFYTPKEIVRYMCRQSLSAYLKGLLPDIDPLKIEQFVKTSDASGFDAVQTSLIDEKLKSIKICDPAIGSGAFPMEILRELFLCRSALEQVSDAAEIKRHIIQNNIYGVDIEKGAVDIARLRFWLSLIVDEKSPETLPNLDFKIMQGNSLLESYKGVDLDTTVHEGTDSLFDSEAEVKRDRLRSDIKSYYSCPDHSVKKQLRVEIQNDVIAVLQANQIATDFGELDFSANSEFFLWHTWFGDVFKRPSEGFDIVIGNPPYIQLQNNGGTFGKLYSGCGFSCFDSMGDIYCLFYERGMQLLREGGHLCYITSNKWMRAGYGEKLRSFLTSKTNPELLLDFAGVKIFKSATVDTNILLLGKAANKGQTLCAVADKKSSSEGIGDIAEFVRSHSSICSFTGTDSWVVLSPIEQSIKRKIEAVGTPLKDWDIKIYRGVLTGCNEAFIITTEKREQILAACATTDERERTAEIIRPILRGRDIKRYGYQWAGLWLINTHNGVKGKLERIHIEDYPAIKAHLDQFWPEISVRADQGDTPYNLRNCAYIEDFLSQKLVYREITTDMEAAIVPEGWYINNKLYMITGNELLLNYLCDFLNSNVFSKIILQSVNFGGGKGSDFLGDVRLPVPTQVSDKFDESKVFNLTNEEETFLRRC